MEVFVGMADLVFILTGGGAAPPAPGNAASAGGGFDPNLIQLIFLGLVILGALFASGLYAASLLEVPWRRALSNTDRQALINALLISSIALLVGIYTLVEPTRRTVAAERQLEHSIDRGVALYGQYCIGCHGIAGQGGPVPEDARKGDSAFAPPLAARADFRPPSEAEQKLKAEVLRKVIDRGRPNTSMPAWSINEGGALNSQDVEGLVDLIQRGDFAAVRVRMTPDQVAKAEATAVASGAALGGGEGGPGKALFLSKGCAACHAIQGVSSGTVGPALSNFGSKPQIAAVLETNKDNLVRWILDPPGVKPGTAMPKLAGVTPEDAANIADYLLSLK